MKEKLHYLSPGLGDAIVEKKKSDAVDVACAACKKAWYCSEQHCKADASRHAEECDNPTLVARNARVAWVCARVCYP